MPEFQLSTLDITIICVYFAGVMFHGWWVGRGRKDSEDYFLAGRALPWYLIGFSLYASNMSGSSFVGLMGASYANGIVVFNYEWTAAVVLIIFAFFMLPYFLKAGIATVPEFLERRYDSRSRLAYSLFTIVAIIFIDTAGALYAGGLVISMLVPGVDLWLAVLGLGLLAGVYTLMGGLSAVVVTDTVQAILLIIGASIIFFVSLDAVGGWDSFMAQTSLEDLSLIKDVDDDFLPWPGLFGVILLGFYYWTLNQFIAQRSLAARTLEDGRKGAIFAGFLKLPNLFIMIMPGVIGLILYPDLPTADLVFPTMAMDLLPTGLRGIVLTALVAAIMSSLDSALNAASTLITIDFVKKYNPRLSGDQLVVVGKVLTGVIMVIGIIYAPFIANFDTLFEYVQMALAFIIPAVVAVYLTGIFSKEITSSAAFWTIIAGLMTGVGMFLMQHVTGLWDVLGLPQVHYTYMAVIIFFAAITLLFLISAISKFEATEAELMFSGSRFMRHLRKFRAPWYKDSHLQALALLAMTFALLYWFW